MEPCGRRIVAKGTTGGGERHQRAALDDAQAQHLSAFQGGLGVFRS